MSNFLTSSSSTSYLTSHSHSNSATSLRSSGPVSATLTKSESAPSVPSRGRSNSFSMGSNRNEEKAKRGISPSTPGCGSPRTVIEDIQRNNVEIERKRTSGKNFSFSSGKIIQ